MHVAQRRELVAIDLLTGREKWRTVLGEGVEWTSSRAPGGGLQIAEPYDPGTGGAVVVPTPDRAIAGYDRETGKLLWRKSYERRITVHGVGRCGVVAVDLDGRLDLLRARDGELVGSFGGIDGVRVARVSIEGRCAVCVVREWGPEKREGVAIIEADTGEVLSFDELRGARSRCAPAASGGRVYCAVAAEGTPDRVGFVPGSKTASLGDDAVVHALRMCGPTLAVLVRARGRRDVVGLDGRSLGARFELGDVGEMPDGSAHEQMQSDDRRLVVVASPDGARSQCLLRAMDAGGARLWERPVGEWLGHYFLGGHVVAVSRGRMEILEADTGRVFAAYPFA